MLKEFVCMGRFSIRFGLAFLFLLLLLCACSDRRGAGTSEESEGLYAVTDLDIAGVTQKGPFASGSKVSVQGVDCKTMKPTGEIFYGAVENDKGEFTVENITLKSSCAMLEVTGYYLNEVTGVKSTQEMTLRVLTNLKNREKANVNILTHLEYERVKYLVSKKNLSFDAAKAQAETEVLAAFDIAGAATEFEDLNIFEQGDANAALLAVSVLMQSDIERTGAWDDIETKAEITDWARTAEASGEMESIRKNVESWNGAAVAPAFEKYVENYDGKRNPVLNPEIEYDSTADARDGQLYKTVSIGNQVWMAQNLNYSDVSNMPELDGNTWCYDDNRSNCNVAGRLYTWAVAVNSLCPEGFHLPDTTEWNTLFAFVGGNANAGPILCSLIGWDDVNGTDDFGMSVYPAGERYHSGSFDSEGAKAYIWTAVELPDETENSAYVVYITEEDAVSFKKAFKDNGASVRCIKDNF